MIKQTNVEFITELMNYSQYGAMIQVFVLEGLRLYAQMVVDNQDDLREDGMVQPDVWIGCAEDVLMKIEEHLK